MIKKDDKIIVGVSGGADSMCLLHVLKEISITYPFTINAIHINHGIRGKEAKKDENFVRDMCKEWKIAFRAYYIDIKKEALLRKCSEEEAGRLVRYETFERVRKEINGSKIAVAHNMNDQAETVLMKIFRGTGMKGLGGIPYIRDNIIRPLLDITREEIENYCIHHNINYRQDYTNELNIYTRNRIRNELIPFVEDKFNPNIIKVLYNMSNILREEEDFLEEQAEDSFMICKKDEGLNVLKLDNVLLKSLHPVLQKRIIRIALKNLSGHIRNIEYGHIQDIIDLSEKPTGKRLNLPNQVIVKKEYEELIFQIGEEDFLPFSYELPVPGVLFINELGISIETKILDNKNFTLTNKNNYTKIFDYDRIGNTLHIRTKNKGDRISLGNGNKKLKDFFIDEKIPRDIREKAPLLADGNKVLWVIGYRYSDAYKITPSTTRILQVRVANMGEHEV